MFLINNDLLILASGINLYLLLPVHNYNIIEGSDFSYGAINSLKIVVLKKGLSYGKCSKGLPSLKQSLDWLQEVNSTALQTALKHLDDGYKRFFKGQNDQPRFKSKRNPVQSYTSKYTNDNIRIRGKRVRLPKLGLVRIKLSKLLRGRIISATVRRTPSNRYYVSLLVEEPKPQAFARTGSYVGIDMGLKDRKLAKSVADVSLSKLVGLLVYKARWFDRKLVKVDRHFPSSQLCSACGYRNCKVKNLDVREWTCPSCHTRHDRDLNASINILKEGERIHLRSTVGTTGVS